MKNKNNSLPFVFRHFALRLSERYNLLITFEEYKSLCKKEFHGVVCKGSKGEPDIKGFMDIHGVKVLVVKRHNKDILVTALPPKSLSAKILTKKLRKKRNEHGSSTN